jgi:hypothetical protein
LSAKYLPEVCLLANDHETGSGKSGPVERAIIEKPNLLYGESCFKYAWLCPGEDGFCTGIFYDKYTKSTTNLLTMKQMESEQYFTKLE